MTATPPFIYGSFAGRELEKRRTPRRLSLRTRSTPGRLRHTRAQLALAPRRGSE